MNVIFKIILQTPHRYRYKKISESVHRLRLIGSDRGGLSGQPDRPFVVNLTKNSGQQLIIWFGFFFICSARNPIDAWGRKKITRAASGWKNINK